MRSKLKRVREERGLDQKTMADRLAKLGHGVRRQTISEWETRDKTIRPCYIDPIRDILDCQDKDLFDIDSGVKALAIKDIPEMLRRLFIEKLGLAIGVSPFLSNMTVSLTSVPQVDADEYLFLCRSRLNQWYEMSCDPLKTETLEYELVRAIPVLMRLSSSLSPFQHEAASCAVETRSIYQQILIGKRRLRDNELACLKTVEIAPLSGDINLVALAQYWLGDHYSYNCNNGVKAIPHLTDALQSVSSVEGDPVLRTAIYSDLSIAHAQCKDQRQAKANARLVLSYHDKAGETMSGASLVSPYRQMTGMGESEFIQFQGKALLLLAELIRNKTYAKSAYAEFQKAVDQPATSIGYKLQAMIRKADAARVLGEKADCLDTLQEAYGQSVSKNRLRQIHEVLEKMPEDWKRSVKDLTEEVQNRLTQ